MNNSDVPELFVEPSSPLIRQSSIEPSKPIDIPQPTSRHLKIVGMHESQSAPPTSNVQFFSNPITRDSRSQSVPLSLDAVRLSRQIVHISDKFNEKQNIKMYQRKKTRSFSGEAERAPKPVQKRHSANLQEWFLNCYTNSNIGSPV